MWKRHGLEFLCFHIYCTYSTRVGPMGLASGFHFRQSHVSFYPLWWPGSKTTTQQKDISAIQNLFDPGGACAFKFFFALASDWKVFLYAIGAKTKGHDDECVLFLREILIFKAHLYWIHSFKCIKRVSEAPQKSYQRSTIMWFENVSISTKN